MYKRVMSRKACLFLLTGMVSLAGIFGLTGCSAEELLSQVPGEFQMQLDGESSSTGTGAAGNSGKDENTENLQDAGKNESIGTNESTGLNGEDENAGQFHMDAGTFSFLNPVASTYAHDSLSPAMQIWYKDMELALGSMQENIKLSEDGLKAGLSENDIDTIFQCVLNDHPEIFYVDGYTYTKYSREDEVVSIEFSGTYQMNREDALSNMMEIEQGAELFLKGISGDASEYDKVKYVFDTIIKNTDYDLQAEDNQNIYSVFVGHRFVCQGYAKATQYLLNRLGMECTLVQGTVDEGEGHAWNLVQVDGSWYYVDTTWGDASYRMQGTSQAVQQMPEVNYDYLCVTTEQLLRTHTLNSYVPMPECMDTAANYYVREGAFLTDYDTEQIKLLFQKMMEQGRTDLTLKCSDMACYDKVRLSLINNQDIFEFLPENFGKVSYAHNEEQLSLTFWVTNS